MSAGKKVGGISSASSSSLRKKDGFFSLVSLSMTCGGRDTNGARQIILLNPSNKGYSQMRRSEDKEPNQPFNGTMRMMLVVFETLELMDDGNDVIIVTLFFFYDVMWMPDDKTTHSYRRAISFFSSKMLVYQRLLGFGFC